MLNKYCSLCHVEVKEDFTTDADEAHKLIYFCTLCVCEDCGKPLSVKPSEYAQSRFCNSYCYSKFKGIS